MPVGKNNNQVVLCLHKELCVTLDKEAKKLGFRTKQGYIKSLIRDRRLLKDE